MAKIIGIRDVGFVGSDGKEVSGKNVYLSEEIDARYGVGVSAERIFLTTERWNNLSSSPAVGDNVTVIYNKYGKVSDIVIS